MNSVKMTRMSSIQKGILEKKPKKLREKYDINFLN